jgi:hypothetical protein
MPQFNDTNSLTNQQDSGNNMQNAQQMPQEQQLYKPK